MLIQQEQMVLHLQIEQIIRWKAQYPSWRQEPTREADGNDVPDFCYDPNYAKNYRLSLGRTEIQPGWGYWDFVRTKTNKYDVKQTVSSEIYNILQQYNDSVIGHNNFIYNDPQKPPKRYHPPGR